MRLSMKRSTVSRKLLQWNWVWKPMMVLPSSPSRISSFQGQMPKVSAFGHGMCQKVMMVALRQQLADHPRRQGEMIVLHQHDGIVGARLARHRLGEAPVDLFVVVPVAFAEHRPDEGDMA